MFIVMMTAMADTPAAEAHARAEAFGPYVATYNKASTQERSLEIHFRGTGDAAVRATHQDGVLTVSVDRTHVRIRLDETTCAEVEARTLIEEVQALGMARCSRRRRRG